jgi:transcriptional regulator GlxA family with amidase domain
MRNGPPSVTQVASDQGFMHFGRFSQYYRSLFGELPSDTLRRREIGASRHNPKL